MGEHNEGRWPKAGDQIFSVGRHAYFAQSAPERDFRLLRGYKEAGDILVQSALTDRYNRDNLIFPALFNYRHYVEVALKAIIEDHGPFAGVSLGPKDHLLPELWNLFATIATAFGHDCAAASTVAVEKCIAEFVTFDARSTTFRYARDRKGSGIPVLPNDGIDLVNLSDVMDGIENFFECADLEFTNKAGQASEAVCT